MPDTYGATPHPLDPLNGAELARAVELVRACEESVPSDLFVSVALDEPGKEELAAGAPHRRARAALWRHGSRELYEARVDLSQDELCAWNLVPGASAPMLVAQVDAALDLARSSQVFVEGLRARGLDEGSQIHLEAWPFGGLLPDRFAGRRVVYTPCWERKTPTGNPYAHPIHGLYAVIDLDTLELLEIEEHERIPVPQEAGDYRASVMQPDRHVAPLEITQPQGAGFTAEGHLLRWQNWQMRVGFCPREGLLIHDVRYNDGGLERKIAHRLSMAELVIPYADPSPGSYRKNAFDTGEIFMGINTNSLTLGCDCLGQIHYIDAWYVDNLGGVRTIGNAICVHEEDTGILWKHTDTDGSVEVRRGRRFVVSSIYTIDNYEYAYYWYFYQDGGIEFEVKFTGIVLTLAQHPGQEAIFGTAVQPGLIAPHHQHVFCARLDLDLDGTQNSVFEVDAVAPERGPLNPYGGSFVEKIVQVRDEGESQRFINPASARYWKVVNPQKLNKMGRPVAYKLIPKNPVTPVAEPTSSIGKRAGFMYADVWVTATDADERYPAGDYPFQSGEGKGLPAWTAQGRPLDSTDVTLWHVFGITHVPRLEDWPIMPVERAGFLLAPFGFFDHNPSLDVPPAKVTHCVSSGAEERSGTHACACA
ncbi:primary-amine oxidase [Ornithinimicrobium cavernae]|uniref:primary-amine oxidase n=1 Tax=Ornithinimicrobium cavernae TaxID=2666047 RepID=UPI000D69B614|nr:primary-amine oxidase [Ornithinimicrobium cavernae]